MNKFLLFMVVTTIRNWLHPLLGYNKNLSPLQQLHLNPHYIRSLAKKYSILLTVGWFFSLFFVAGAAMMIYSAARSVDDFGFFMMNQVFYISTILAVASALVVGICLWLGLSTKISADLLYASKEEKADFENETEVVPPILSEERIHITRPIFEGIKEGWMRDRRAS